MELPKLDEYLSEAQWVRSLIHALREYRKELPAWETQTPIQKQIEAQVMHILVLCYVLEELEKADDQTKSQS